MRAAVYKGPDQGLAIETIPDPEPGQREVVIRVESSGICGTDLHMTDGHGLVEASPGSVLGHEYAGEVVAIGSDVHGVTSGQRVTALAMPACGQCGPCQSGDLLWCEGDDKIAATTGGFAEFVAVGAAATVPLPDGVTSELGALAEPLSVAHHGVELASLHGDERIVVIGAGPIALAVTYWIRSRGIGQVTVVARTARREALARAMGAASFVATTEGQTLSEIEKADIVFEAAGSRGALSQALEYVRPRGTVIGLGFYDEPDTIVPALWVMPEIRLQFAMMYSKVDFAASLEELREHPEDLGRMITAVIPLGDLPKMFTDLRGPSNQGKVLVNPTLG